MVTRLKAVKDRHYGGPVKMAAKQPFVGEHIPAHLFWWAISSVVERCPDKTEVEGSIPSLPTKIDGSDTI